MASRILRSTAAAIILSQVIYLFRLVGRGGFGWDDVQLRQWGFLNLETVLTAFRARSLSLATNGPAQKVLDDFDRDKGAWFDLALAAVESQLHQVDLVSGLSHRQQATILVWAIGAALMFGTLRKAFGELHAVWGTMLYGAMPYLLGNALVNSKDTTFMVAYLLAVRTLLFALEAKTVHSYLSHGLSLGLLLATRSIGAVMIATSILLIYLSQARASEEEEDRTIGLFGAIATTSVATAFFAVLFWPALWFTPLRILAYSLRKNAAFPAQGSMLYFGELVPALELPWHYPVVWIALTSPLVWVILMLIGLSSIAKRVESFSVASAFRAFSPTPSFAFSVAYLVPLVAVIGLGSTLYDGWRHLLFLVPGIIALVLAGITVTASLVVRLRSPKNTSHSFVFGATAALAVLVGLAGMISSHPYPSVYKNSLLFGSRVLEFEDDYWALSTMEMVGVAVAQWEENEGDELRIFPAVFMPTYRLARYAAIDDPRVSFVESEQDADFVMTTFRSVTDREAHIRHLVERATPVHEVIVQRRVIGLLVRQD